MYRTLPTRPRNGCYCCCGPSETLMDIDSALHELGMLSTVTESRRQYLQELKERNRVHSESSIAAMATPSPSPSPRGTITSLSGYQLVQIDTKYVQGVSTVSPGPPTPDAVLDPRGKESSRQFSFGTYRTQAGNCESEARRNRMARIRFARSQRYNKPYSIPGRLYHSLHEFDLQAEQGAGGERQKSKSNASSPIKPSGGVSLVRSRSLDNLNLCRMKLTNLLEFKESKLAVEEVSQEMENLNVKD